jgi:arabinose-5-phosphate isomerase
MKYAARAREVINDELAGLEEVRDALGESFERAVDLILKQVRSGGKVVITGLGKSLHIGQKIASTLTSTGTPATTLHPSEAMHGDLGVLRDGDVLLAISFSGGSEELLNLIPAAHRRNVRLVAMTGDTTNPLAREADEIILVPVKKEACPFNMAPTTSTTATLAMGDALAIVLLEAQGFKKDDYAKLHPGGAIGRTLLLRVEQIMRTGPRLAKVPGDASVKDAVLAMTRAKSGSVAVVDGEDRLLGIFTDGDLRRHVTSSTSLVDLKVKDVMTPSPIALTADRLAVDVLSIFEAHDIDDLVIVDEENRVVGLVDIQDLPKLKIL